MSIFTSSQYSFEGKRETEKVEVFLYKHWVIIGIQVLFHIFLAFIPFLLIIIFGSFILENNLGTIVFFVSCLYFMLIWSSVFFALTMYLLDTWIVTSERVLDMRQHGFFSRTISDMSLDRIQDVSVKTTGFIPTILGFGNVEIQSAGTIEKFIFKQVANPERVKDAIMEMIEKNKKV